MYHTDNQPCIGSSVGGGGVLFECVCVQCMQGEGEALETGSPGLHIEIKGEEVRHPHAPPHKLNQSLTTVEMKDVVSLCCVCYSRGPDQKADLCFSVCSHWSLYLGLTVVVMALL